MKLLTSLFIVTFALIVIIHKVNAKNCYTECEYQCSSDTSDCLGQCALNNKLWDTKDPNKSDMAGCLGTCRVTGRSCSRNCSK